MVNVENGKLVTVDPALKQFLLNLDEKREFQGRRFILKGKSQFIKLLRTTTSFSDKHILSKNLNLHSDLDETHLFVIADCDTWLKGRLADLMTENSFPIGEHV